MRIVKWTSFLLVLCLALSLCAPCASAEISEPHLQSADAVLVVDMTTGITLYEKNADEYHSIASLTKIMTCLLAVEAVERGDVSLTDQVTAGSDCLQGLDTSSSNAGITPGEVFSFQDLIYMALVHSANDACNVIAVHVAGSIGSFVELMNARAEELGCQNTHFVDTDGMLNRTEGHYSCPRDLYLIAKEALTHPLFATVCSTSSYTVSASNYRESFDIHNSNALMSTEGIYGSGYIYDGVIGVKTGFTKPAGYCLVSACKRTQGYIMVIVLGCNGPLTYTFAGEYQNFQDSITLYDWAFKNYSNKTMFLAGEPLKRLSVEKAADNGTVALCAAESLTLLLPNDVTESDITVDIRTNEGALVAPIEEGEVLGTADVYVSGKLYSSISLTADASVSLDKKVVRQEKIDAFLHSGVLKAVIIVVVLLILALIALRLFLKLKKRQELAQRMQQRDRQKQAQRRDARMQQRQQTSARGAPQPQMHYSAEELAARQAANEKLRRSYAQYQDRPRTEETSSSRRVPTNGGVKIERVTREPEQRTPVMHDASSFRKAPEKTAEPSEQKIQKEEPKESYDLEDLLKAFRDNQG